MSGFCRRPTHLQNSQRILFMFSYSKIFPLPFKIFTIATTFCNPYAFTISKYSSSSDFILIYAYCIVHKSKRTMFTRTSAITTICKFFICLPTLELNVLYRVWAIIEEFKYFDMKVGTMDLLFPWWPNFYVMALTRLTGTDKRPSWKIYGPQLAS